MLTKNAVGNLINRYKAVLANCRLMNMFGSLALAAGLVTGAAMGLTLAGVSDAMAEEHVLGEVVEIDPSDVESLPIISLEDSDYTLLEIGPAGQTFELSKVHVVSGMQMMEAMSRTAVDKMFGMMFDKMDASKGRDEVSDNAPPVYIGNQVLSQYEESLKNNLTPNSGVGNFAFQGWAEDEAHAPYEGENGWFNGVMNPESPSTDSMFGGDIQVGEIGGGLGNSLNPSVVSIFATDFSFSTDAEYQAYLKNITSGGAAPASFYSNLSSTQTDRFVIEHGDTLWRGDGSTYTGKFPTCTIYQVDGNGALIHDPDGSVPADGVVPAPNGSDSLDLKNDSFIIKDANSYNMYSTANMYADASNDSGTFSDMGTSRSYMSPTDAVWSAFISPFYGKSGQNNGDMQSNMVGLNMGATRFLNDQTLFGFSASISRARSDTDGADSSGTSYAVGMHAMYMFNDSAYIRGQVAGMLGQSDYDFQKDLYGQRFAADADMDSYGLYAQMAVGYSFLFGNSGGADSGSDSEAVANLGNKLAKGQGVQHTVRPELALSYFYNHMDGYSARYYDRSFGNGSESFPTGYEFSVRSADYDALYTDLAVSWTGAFALGHGEKDYGLLKPTVKVGVRQALTDPEVSSTMEMFRLSTVSHSDLNETAFLCDAGVAWEMDEVTLSVKYSGEFGNVQYSHSGMFMVEWEF